MVCIYLHEKIKSNIILYNPLNGMQMSLETFVVCFIIFILLKKKKPLFPSNLLKIQKKSSSLIFNDL